MGGDWMEIPGAGMKLL